MNRWLQWRLWFHLLAAAFISGGASAVTTQGGLALGQTAGVDVRLLNWKELATVFVSSGVFSVLTFLRKSPLPPIEGSSEEKAE